MLWGTVTGVAIKVCALSLCSEFVHVGCVDKVVDGPHGW